LKDTTISSSHCIFSG